MAIDVGASCSDRGNYWSNYTAIGDENPANATGTIDYICTWIAGATNNFEVASFVHEGSNVLSTNGVSGNLGALGSGQHEFNAPGDFTAFNIFFGEHIGFYHGTPAGIGVEKDFSGVGGYWYTASDQIPCSSATFSYSSSRTQSLYATGTEAGGEEYQRSVAGSLAAMSASLGRKFAGERDLIGAI